MIGSCRTTPASAWPRAALTRCRSVSEIRSMLTLRSLVLPFALVFMAACAPLIPRDYTGPRATLKDRVVSRTHSQVGIFAATKVNDLSISDAISSTRRANQGMGLAYARTDAVSREVAAQRLKVRIEGVTQSASDIQALFTKQYAVAGDVTLDARGGKTYVLNGVLEPTDQSVWIEDEATGRRVTEIVRNPTKAGAAR
jgi:hypothetical protein